MPPYLFAENVVLPLVGMGIGVLFLIGVYKTVNRFLDRRHERALAEAGAGAGGDSALLEAVGQLNERVAQIEDGMMRIQELEERLDFTERVLAQQRRELLPPGESGRPS